MQAEGIDKEAINKITKLASIREKAFFTIMRQSGLNPKMLMQLKIKDIEQGMPIPCKISLPEELRKGKCQKYPIFVGKEAVTYLNQYLKTRNNLTSESLLFSCHTNPKKEINTKDVSRTFKQIITKKIIPTLTNKAEKDKLNKLTLYDLINFYKENTKSYVKTLKNTEGVETDTFFRTIYNEKALPFLEIQEEITIEVRYNKKDSKKKSENYMHKTNQ